MKPYLPLRNFGRGVIRGDSADISQNSLRDGENVRLDLTGDVVCRQGTGLVTVANLPSECFGPWEYQDASGKKAFIVADSTGGIWEVNNGATKIAQMPSTLSQTVRAVSAFNRLYFVNGIDAPHYLRWGGASWEFRQSGISSRPITPTVAAIPSDTFTAPATSNQRTAMAYQPGSGNNFLLRDLGGGPADKEIKERFKGSVWEAISGPEGSALGGPMSWYDPTDSFNQPRGVAMSSGYYSFADALSQPNLGEDCRKAYVYDWDSQSFGYYTLFASDTGQEAFNENVLWSPGAQFIRPRTWGDSLYVYTMYDISATPATPIRNRKNGYGFYRVSEFNSTDQRLYLSPMHQNHVVIKNDAAPAAPQAMNDADFRAAYYSIWSAFATATDTPDVVYVIEQPGTDVPNFAPSGNARLIRYDISGGSADRVVVQADCGFALGSSRRSALVCLHGNNDGKLHFIQDGSATIRTYTIATNSWSSTVTVIKNGPFETSAPDNDYLWYFDATDKLSRELLPGGTVAGGTADFKFSVTWVDNVGAESLPSDEASINVAVDSTVQISGIQVGASGVVKRRVYGTLADGTTNYFITEIADNSSTTAQVSTDDLDRDTAREAPSVLSVGAPPTGVKLVATFFDGLIYAATDAKPNTWWWTPSGQPDNIPLGNEAQLGFDKREIIAMEKAGNMLAFFKTNEIWTLSDLPTITVPFLRSPIIGLKFADSVVQDHRLGLSFVSNDGIYAFDGYNVAKLSIPINGAFSADLMNASKVFGFRWNDRLFFMTNSGKAYIYEPAYRRWLPSDDYGITVRGANYIENEHNLSGGALSLNGIWILSNDSKMRYLENPDSTFDNAEWDTDSYTLQGSSAVDISWFIETQNFMPQTGKWSNFYAIHVDSEVEV